MWCNRIFFLIIFYYSPFQRDALADNLTDFENLLKTSNIRSTVSNGMSSIVYINEHEYEISDLGPRDRGFHKSTIYKFYVCMNCMFATWTRGELVQLTEFFPTIFNLNYEPRKNNIFIEKNDDIVNKFNAIERRTDDFISILFNFFDKITYLTYLDPSVLKALLSLKFKIAHMKQSNNGVDELKGLDNKIIQLVMEVVNDLHIFMTANCKLSERYYNKILFPYFEPHLMKIDISTFLEHISPLNLKTEKNNQCSIDKILLFNMFENDINVFYGLRDISHSFGCDVPIAFKDILPIMHSVYDLKVIHWYQELIMNSIIRLIYVRLQQFFSNYKPENQNNDFIRDSFKTLNEQFFSTYHNMPKELVKRFEILANKSQYDKDDINLFQNNSDLLEEIQLRPVLKISNVGSVMRWNNPRYRELEKSTLTELLKDLRESLPHFKCFLDTFRFLSKEFNTYYMPFKRDHNAIVDFILNGAKTICTWMLNSSSPTEKKRQQILDFNSSNNLHSIIGYKKTKVYKDEKKAIPIQIISRFYLTATRFGSMYSSFQNDKKSKDIRDEACNFFMALIYDCIETLRYINLVRSTDSVEDIKLIHNKLDKIKTLLIEANERYLNYRLRTVTHNLFPYIEVHFKNHSTVFDFKYTLRIMSIMAIELNYYGLDYCNQPKHDLLAKSPIQEFAGFDYHDHLIGGYLRSVHVTKEQEHMDSKGSRKYNKLALDDIYDGFYAYKVQTYRSFGTKITMKWKGEVYKTIENIHDDIVLNVTQSFYYYSFSDVLVKFVFAAIILEMDEFRKVTSMKSEGDDDCSSFLGLSNTFIEKKTMKLGTMYTSLIENMSKGTQYIHSKLCLNVDKDSDYLGIRQSLTAELELLGVSINTDEDRENNSTDDESQKESVSNGSDSKKTKPRHHNLLQEFSLLVKLFVTIEETFSKYYLDVAL